jgi:hypothetical protein
MKYLLAFILTSLLPAAYAQSLDQILADIGSLEADKDPKCYATASRLEDFMYGTPLSDEARFQKNKLQKRLAEIVWRIPGEDKAITPEGIDAAFSQIITFRSTADGAQVLSFPNGSEIKIRPDDVRQYGSVAYSLRAILAVQQESMMNPDQPPLVPLSGDALEAFKTRLDLATLALLQEADAYARANDEYEITLDNINRSWAALFRQAESAAQPQAASTASVLSEKPPLLKQLIRQKVSSYAQYNQISNQLFVRNMQVYFARLSWPEGKEAAEAFRQGFIEALVGYGIELYKGVIDLALANGHTLIHEEDVARFVARFTPFEVNAYEDVTYFPSLPGAAVTLESYDLDAFRDSGVHWVYLGHALDSQEVTRYLDADPFAAELLAENMAQFGVLLLREAGLEGQRRGEERLSLELLGAAMGNIQAKVSATVAGGAAEGPAPAEIQSSEMPDSLAAESSDKWFADRTDAVGIDLMHRSSDWLSRLLRSYLRRDANTGVITIPPAFGGSGLAAGDIDNDGFPDLLLLSGLGNRLYLNDGQGGFTDITGESGIAWLRPADRRPGEPRQALMADLDNDGWQDIVITYVDDDHRVYRNRGDRTFEDLTARAGLGGKGLVGGPATVFDYDNDGLLDIYVMYFGDYIHGVLPTLKRINGNGLPNRLFRNRGDFKFTKVKAGVEDAGWGQAVAHTDFNVDNLQDLIVGNDFGSNVYYQNRGDGSFADVTAQLGTGKPSYTMNVGLADLNADQVPDIYISNIVTMNKDEKYVLPNEETQMKFNIEKLAHLRVVEANDLFISSRALDGTIGYTLNRELVGRGYNSTGWSWGASFLDADLDGDDDLYVLNGMNEYNLYSSKNSYAEPGARVEGNRYLPVDTKESNVFFVNSNGRLNNVSQRSGLDLLGNSRSAAYLDFDNDGDLDIAVNNYHEKARFFENGAERLGANWIKLRLQGDPALGCNRDAIGAKVIFALPGGKRIWREVRSGEAYLTVHERTVHAGLGNHGQADVLVVWPGGERQIVKGLEANRTHRIAMSPDAGE